MANSILEQILENVRNGARLPSEDGNAALPPHALIDAEFQKLDAALARAIAEHAGTLPDGARERLGAILARLLAEEFGGEWKNVRPDAAGAPGERAILEEISGRLATP